MRGAPAIGVVGILSLVAEVYNLSFTSVNEFRELIKKQLDYLVSARPTAVNMADARTKLLQQLQCWTQQDLITPDELKRRYRINSVPEKHKVCLVINFEWFVLGLRCLHENVQHRLLLMLTDR